MSPATLIKRVIPRPVKTRIKRWQFRAQWNQYELHAREFFRQFIPPGSVAFDVGANVGDRSKVFASLADRVIAVEPQAGVLGELRARLGDNPKVTIVPKALGEAPGTAEMFLADASGVSSLSSEYIETAKRTNRFPGVAWDGRQVVEMTTLDALIAEFGQPAFIKIDVEGFELSVLKGLSRPVAALSFEFIPERHAVTLAILEYLGSLGTFEANISIGDSMKMDSSEWARPEILKTRLQALPDDTSIFGDIYVRFKL